MLMNLLGRFFPSKQNDVFETPAHKARHDLLELLKTLPAFGRASESMTRGMPELEGKPMYVLNGRMQRLAENAGLLTHDPRYSHRLRVPERGDVLIVGKSLHLVCGDFCAKHG